MASCNEAGTESEKSKQCPCKCGKGIAVFLVLFLFAGIACWYIHHPNRPRAINPEIDLKPGTICIVQFRRDALNASFAAPLTTAGHVSMVGRIIAIDRDVIILEHVEDTYRMGGAPIERLWIPKSSILLIGYGETLPTLNLTTIRGLNDHADL